jgi:hypothetical protein
MMHQYTMRFLDQLEVPILQQRFVAADDSAAISHALTFCKTHLIELLQGDRVIARIPKGALGTGPVKRLDPLSPTERVR